MSEYEDSLAGRVSFMLVLNVTRITDVGVAVAVASLPVLLVAIATNTIGYAVIAVLGVAVSLGSQIARWIFDAGGYAAILDPTDDDTESVDVSIVMIGVLYINLVIGASVVAGALVSQLSVAAAVAVAMIYPPLDIEWGSRRDRVAPIWWATTMLASLAGSDDPLGRVRSLLWKSGGDVVRLFTAPRRSNR